MTKRWTHGEVPDLSERTIVVTGANSGLGSETALALAAKGASVVMACRSVTKGETAAATIRERHPGAKVEVFELDLARLESVEQFAGQLAERFAALDVLCNNAGVMALPHQETADGFEMQFGTNHLGHFALTGRLLPLLLKSPNARVVTVSSIYHRYGAIRFDDLSWQSGYDKWKAYSMSKIANLLFAFELQRRFEAAGKPTISVAAHPGYSATNLQHVGPQMTGAAIEKWLMRVANALFAQSAHRGALPQLYACVAPGVQGGEYFGPSGPMELWGAPRRVTSNEASQNLEDARRLWSVSAELTGVNYELLASQ